MVVVGVEVGVERKVERGRCCEVVEVGVEGRGEDSWAWALGWEMVAVGRLWWVKASPGVHRELGV